MRLIISFFFAAFLLSSCATVSYHDGANYDPEVSMSIIKELKLDTLLIAFPTYQEKELILRSSIKSNSKNKINLEKRLSDLKKQQATDLANVKKAFNREFTFCPILYIPDSLVHAFENGEERAFFVGAHNKLNAEIIYSNRNPIKFLSRSETQWDLRIGNELLPNPFPNYISYRNGLLELLGIQDFEDIISNIANALNRRLEKFYSNPTRAVSY